MEQGSSSGSRSSGDYPAGASASTSAEGNGGDSSVDKVTKSNQEEEEEEEDDRSAYGSEGFDDQSKGSVAESEVGVERVCRLMLQHRPCDEHCHFPHFKARFSYCQIRHTHTASWSTTH